MSSWVQFQQNEDDFFSFARQTCISLINLDHFDEIVLDLDQGNPCSIIANQGRKKTVLFKGQPEEVTAAWLNLTQALPSKPVETFERKKDEQEKFAFPNMYEEEADAVVNAFLIRTSHVKTEKDLLSYERLLLTACVKYLCVLANDDEQDFLAVSELLNNLEIREDDEEFKNAVDMLFEDAEAEDKEAQAAVKAYNEFKKLPKKTQIRVRNSCCERLKAMGFSMDISNKEETQEYWKDWDIWDDFDEWDKEES